MAIEDKNNKEFKGRELRIKKAVAPGRLAKKEKQRQDTRDQKKEEKIARTEARYGPRNGRDDDSDSENPETLLKEGRDMMNLSKKSKKIKKAKKSDDDELGSYIAKIQKKAERAAREAQVDGLDITPKLAFKKKVQ